MEYSGEDNLNVMKYAENYNDSLVDDIVSSIKSSANVIVDFGSGDGWFAKKIHEKLNKDIICIEPAQNMKKYYSDNVRLLDDLDELDDNSVDAIYSLNVLEHIENDADIINKFYNKLKKGGILYLYLPALQCLYTSMDEKVGHYRRYSKSRLKELLFAKKWHIFELKYADFLGFFVTLIFKFIGNKNGEISVSSIKIYDKLIFPLSKFFDKLTHGKIVGKNIVAKATKRFE